MPRDPNAHLFVPFRDTHDSESYPVRTPLIPYQDSTFDDLYAVHREETKGALKQRVRELEERLIAVNKQYAELREQLDYQEIRVIDLFRSSANRAETIIQLHRKLLQANRENERLRGAIPRIIKKGLV